MADPGKSALQHRRTGPVGHGPAHPCCLRARPPSWDSQGTVGGKFVDGTFGRRLYYTAADGATVRIGLANRDSSSAPPTNPPAAPPTETTSLMSSWRILALVSVVATDASIAIAWFFWFKKTRNLTKQLWQPFPPPQLPPETGRLTCTQ